MHDATVKITELKLSHDYAIEFIEWRKFFDGVNAA
jgi:hypothetical protein